ncbi:diguanylate cyclase with PAS/PAC sensor [Cellvibrio sp. BR]|jgi:diguanylate cyclase (GGDEF)-like protein|uniref:histidine kinase N-terminal 7TM domain-containing diguanylate cyclase n=1 Tax=unclassified Cellvibrio TaxID=2624793 RepID=UPI000260081F|nr:MULTISPECIES: histidine kinase N-terminal 7TM domain-containing protein [unclassified Cellvibrio]EIK46360.1 diguanylate cyclase with PAS/PAC sensor [Cellvibrio sp. BR]QEY11575.1 GGDEF domain-containing protein [Cellvibrio sp. KY-YJ-3]
MNLLLDRTFNLSFPVIFTLGICAGVSWLAHWVSRQRTFPGRFSFVLIHLASLWWLFAAALEMAVLQPNHKIFWAAMAWPGIVAAPTFWAIFLWQYVNSIHRPLARWKLAVLMLMPLCCWLLALTNPVHQLFYGAATAPINNSPGAAIRYAHGPLFYAAAVYVYLFMLFCIAVVIQAAVRSRGLYRRHYLAFVLVTAVPWAANISYVVFGKTIFGFDPTPFSFAFTLAAFAWLIVGVRLFDVLPVARHLLLDALLDPVLVIDTQQRVIEANPAALALANSPTAWQGCALEEWPVIGRDLQQLLALHINQQEPQLLTLADGERFYELRASAITRATRDGPLVLGKMLYLRDVTQRYLSELKLSEALALSEQRLKTITNLHELLREQALRDPLTGLYNRRYLDEFFALEIARARRHSRPMVLALIDLDHFKQLNDDHGHLIGDDVLKSVALFLVENVRASDVLFRIGGEEFLVILPDVDAQAAFTRLNKLCSAFAAVPMDTRKGGLSLTFSAGLALWPEQGDTLDELILHADAALYRAKAAGRNCVHQ